jgi:phosphoribosyl 1,2-cyclic phosphodiesterase
VVWTSKTRLLVDAGLELKRVQRGLEYLGLARVDGILITHAHGDHIGQTTLDLSFEMDIPVYCNRNTWRIAKSKNGNLRELEECRPRLVRFFGSAAFRVGDLTVKPFRVPHEGLAQHYGHRANDHAGSPVGFAITHKHHGQMYGVGYATDLGKVPDSVVGHLADVDVLILEANHCEHLVEKKRLYHRHWVLCDAGHLSNYDAGGAIVGIMDARSDGGRPLRVLLAHISKDHNTGSRALSQVRAVLKDCDVKLAGLHLTYQDRRSRVVEVGR